LLQRSRLARNCPRRDLSYSHRRRGSGRLTDILSPRQPPDARFRLIPGSEAAPEALKVMPRDAAISAARSIWLASSRESCSYGAWSGHALPSGRIGGGGHAGDAVLLRHAVSRLCRKACGRVLGRGATAGGAKARMSLVHTRSKCEHGRCAALTGG
jgi:hypothetical protein